MSNNQELKELFDQDQACRGEDTKIDWKIVSANDSRRLNRIKELYSTQKLQTGADYYHAAMILQHGECPEDYLLAHELCIVAICKGENRAKWLAAASEDRFLMHIGRPQRFATQYRGDGNQSPRLYEVDESVTDEIRREFGVRSLNEARELEIKLR